MLNYCVGFTKWTTAFNFLVICLFSHQNGYVKAVVACQVGLIVIWNLVYSVTVVPFQANDSIKLFFRSNKSFLTFSFINLRQLVSFMLFFYIATDDVDLHFKSFIGFLLMCTMKSWYLTKHRKRFKRIFYANVCLIVLMFVFMYIHQGDPTSDILAQTEWLKLAVISLDWLSLCSMVDQAKGKFTLEVGSIIDKHVV